MNAGELKHWITIQRSVISQDSELNSIETWSDVITVRAAALPKTGREFYQLSTRNSEITEAFHIRYHAAVTPHMRVKFGSRYLDIIDVTNPKEGKRELLLLCKGVV